MLQGWQFDTNNSGQVTGTTDIILFGQILSESGFLKQLSLARQSIFLTKLFVACFTVQTKNR